MSTTPSISDSEIQDYLDGRLDEEQRARVAALLRSNPGLARQVEELRRQDEALRALGAPILEEPIPQRLLEVLNTARQERSSRSERRQGRVDQAGHVTRRRPALVQAALALLIFAAGVAAGWGLRPGPPDALPDLDLVVSEASFAFSFLAREPAYPIEFGPDQGPALATVIERTFAKRLLPPDLSEAGYSFQGATIRSTARRQVGFFLFRDREGSLVCVTFWPSALPADRRAVSGRFDKVFSRRWLDEGFGFALMSEGGDDFLVPLVDPTVAHFERLLGSE